MKKEILVISNTSWSIFNFRRGLIAKLVEAGYSVTVSAPFDSYSSKLVERKLKFVPIPMDNKGANPVIDFILLVRIWLLLRRERPLCALTFTTKPNIYAALAAKALRIPVVPNIAGLGSSFAEGSWISWLVRFLYRMALAKAFRVYFQNRDDHDFFIRERLIERKTALLLPGSGVDTTRFSPRSSAKKQMFQFLMFGRLLWEKGVSEYIAAARELRASHANVQFVLLGFLDVPSRSALRREDVEPWIKEGVISFIEATEDVVPYIADADCVVLPTYYREGTPRALLEAASMGKPVIATRSPGCRDAICDGVTGFLITPKATDELVSAMQRVLHMSAEGRHKMGVAARDLMLRRFDETIVTRSYVEIVRDIEGTLQPDR